MATLDRYFAAISADDFATMTALQMPYGKTHRARTGILVSYDVYDSN